jgi:hypothetical protein
MVFLISSAAEGQTKKYKARLSIDYNKVMDSNPFLSIAVKFKGENGYEPAKKLSLEVYQQVKEDSLVHIGEVVTNMKGDAFFNLKDHQQVAVDSLIENIYVVRLEKSEKFKDASKSVKYYDVNLIANSIEKDSVNHITAKLTDAMGNPIEGVKLKVMVQRLFAPLQVGESYYKTKDNGTILVPIEEPLPGINGDLTF